MPVELVEVEARDDEVEFSISTDARTLELVIRLEGASVAEARTTAHKIVERLEVLEVRARTELVAAFLHLVNVGYLEEGAEPLSEASFLERAAFSRLESDVDGNLWFFFDDNDMLWGHTMILDTDLDGAVWNSTSWG